LRFHKNLFRFCVTAQAVVLQHNDHQYYVHYVGMDKRMDEWVDEQLVTEDTPATTPMSTNNGAGAGGSSVSVAGTRGRKRKRKSVVSNGVAKQPRQGSGEGVVNGQEIARGREIASVAAAATPSAPLTEEELDMREHRQITATRNFDKVNFGQWQIKTWYVLSHSHLARSLLLYCSQFVSFFSRFHGAFRRYYSPYPMSEAEADDVASASTSSNLPASRVQNVNKPPPRVHGRTSDLLAGALGRESVLGQKAVLWVCDRCFKYMREGIAFEVHSVWVFSRVMRSWVFSCVDCAFALCQKSCHWMHPPGRKVYQRGAHIIWEVDGAKEKVRCGTGY
jgi:histone acetyltransferase HTATIP/histone acetyltransferase MYST1